MIKIVLLSVVFCCFNTKSFSQQLPLNTCGIVNVYDASGNRTKRVYFCNNGGVYPNKLAETATTEEYQVVDALYPNPTTGRFSVTFSKALKDASIFVTDVNGKIVTQFKASGYKIEFNLSSVAAGVYFVRVEEGESFITKKVVKQ